MQFVEVSQVVYFKTRKCKQKSFKEHPEHILLYLYSNISSSTRTGVVGVVVVFNVISIFVVCYLC